MKFRLVLGILALCIGWGTAGHATATSAASEPDRNSLVVVVEDKTLEADCKIWVDSPANERACDPGSVLFARRATYSDVKRDRINDYVVLTGDKHKDTILERRLVADVTVRIRSEQVRPSACTEARQWVGGSYLSVPDNSNSIKITYELKYRLRADCVVDFISDRAHVDKLSLGWQVSCVNKNQNCTQRGVVMGVNWQPRNGAFFGTAFNSFVGQEYWHISSSPCWNCGNPYGIFPFK